MLKNNKLLAARAITIAVCKFILKVLGASI
jgi:hypothetical protein